MWMTLCGPNFAPFRGIGGDAVDPAVIAGKAGSHSELVARVLLRESAAQEGSAPDAAFSEMAQNSTCKAEAQELVFSESPKSVQSLLRHGSITAIFDIYTTYRS